MAQETVHVSESAAVPKIDIAIVNDNSVAVSIFRLDPNTFEEESVAELGVGEEKSIRMGVTDSLVAKIDGNVFAEFGFSEELREWRLRRGDSELSNGPHCRFAVRNHRSESVTLFRTAGENGKILLNQVLDAGAQTVQDSFTGEYWEAMIGDQVVSAYQPSARLPVWEIDNNVVCNFVPDLQPGDDNLNETSEPRPIDQPAVGEVKAVMVFVDFPDVPGEESLNEIKQAIVGDAEDWFWQESYGRLDFVVETPVLQWRCMPRNATDYANINRDGEAHHAYISTALKLFRKTEINFGDYQIAYVVAAKTPKDNLLYREVLHNSPTLSAGIEVETNNGKVNHVVTFGRDSYHRGFHVLVHETGHLFGLPDLYRFEPVVKGEWLTPSEWLRPTGAWDIMCDLDQGRHFLGWHKYKLDWLDASQLIYFSSGELSIRLTSLESAQGAKMIVLPSENPSRLYIVEIGQALGEDETFCDKGLLIYTVDAAKPTGWEPVSVQSCGSRSEDLAVGMRCNDYLAPGESHILRLPNGAEAEVFNREQHGADFEVKVVIR